MKKTTLKNKTIAVTAAALSLAVLAGCVSSGSSPAAGSVASDPSSTTQNQAMGTILLSVNPEIEIDYDDGGRVLEIEGLNEEGKAVIKDFTGYEGQACRTVVEDLVEEIYADGYFENTVGGHTKNIVVKLEEGSRYPDDDFLEDVAEGVRGAVKTCHLDSSTMTVNEDDYAENGYIGLDKAKELVLGQLGLEEATFTEREYELDDGVYELEFTANGVEYEFEVNAVTGKVTEADYDHNDDWKDYDDRDDDRDDNNDDDRDDDRDDNNDDDRDDDNDDNNDDDRDDDRDDNNDDDRDDDKDDNNDDDRDDDKDDDKNDDNDDDNDDDRDDDKDDNNDDDRDDDNDDDDDDRPAATKKPTVKPTAKPTTRPVQNDDDDDDDRYDDDKNDDNDDDNDDDRDDDNDDDNDDDKDDDHDDDRDDDNDD